MLDKNKLMAKLVSCGYSQVRLADELKIPRSSLNLKINGRRNMQLSLHEAQQIKTKLGITDAEEAMAIFFAPEVPDTQQSGGGE